MVVYTHNDDKDELEAKARAGVIPIVANTPGYISYGVMFDDNRVVSISQWESEEHAKEAGGARRVGEGQHHVEERDAFHRRPGVAGTRLPVVVTPNTMRLPASVGDRFGVLPLVHPVVGMSLHQ